MSQPTDDTRPALNIQQVSKQSATEAVYEQLRELIGSGGLRLGDRLPSEHELALSFGVSRPIVRESLGILRSEGMVESRSGSGNFVKATEPKSASLLLQGRYESGDLHEVRTHLEVPGAGLAAQRRTDEDLAEMEAIVARHAGCDDVAEWVSDDLAFHIAIASATGNELQVRLVTELRELQLEQTVVTARMMGTLAAPAEEHEAIVNAIRERDVEGARAAMESHLDAIRDRVRTQADAAEVSTNAAKSRAI